MGHLWGEAGGQLDLGGSGAQGKAGTGDGGLQGSVWGWAWGDLPEMCREGRGYKPGP